MNLEEQLFSIELEFLSRVDTVLLNMTLKLQRVYEVALQKRTA